MHLTGVRAAFGHLVFEAVQFAQDIDRNADVVLGKAVDAGGIVQQDVGVENEGLGGGGSTRAAAAGGGR